MLSVLRYCRTNNSRLGYYEKCAGGEYVSYLNGFLMQINHGVSKTREISYVNFLRKLIKKTNSYGNTATFPVDIKNKRTETIIQVNKSNSNLIQYFTLIITIFDSPRA